MHILEIINLKVKVEDKIILDGINLKIKSGETHVIMGPNGIGKSTLLKTIMGDPNYTILDGDILFDNESILNKPVDERARLGLFLSMQSPIAISGVTNADFLKTAAKSKYNKDFKLLSFINELESISNKLSFDKDFLTRDVNLGFSGGEKKKSEILQMYVLKPFIALLDEIDSGLDVDSLKLIGKEITNYKKEYNCGILLITHYQRLLDYIKPDYVHIMCDGKIIKTGDSKLVKYIEDNGYENISKISTNIVKDNNKNE